jgi:uncharacterized membrane protein YeiB
MAAGRQAMGGFATNTGNDALQPLAQDERIQALDVIRGFALLGIFLMNVEWFNRPIAELDAGMPLAAHGIDYVAGWLVHVFVRGKFWTLFSLLFGMGFAVMLTRAERGGRAFVAPYLRRIAALALFGACHFVFVWAGDILFSYALGAAVLLLLYYGRLGWMVPATIACLGLGLALKIDLLAAAAAPLGVACLLVLYLRYPVGAHYLGRRWHLFTGWHVLTLVSWPIAVALLAGAIAQSSVAMGVSAAAVALVGVLATHFHDPASKRSLRAGAALYLAPFLVAALIGALLSWQPQWRHQDAKQLEEQQKQRTEHVEEARREAQAMTGASYAAAVKYRIGRFPKEVGVDLGFAGLVIGMFLVGVWFVRSGVMEHTRGHLPLFRKLAFVGLPIGLAMGVASALIATSHVPGQNDMQYQAALGLLMAGNLPACLGYASVVVLMLHSNGVLSKVSVLAPAGRMALTNYLSQSVVQCVFFYGFFLGHWGMGRAWQLLFVIAVYALQVAFSHLWLKRFRYGPMEWLWRSITYWRPQPMLRA